MTLRCSKLLIFPVCTKINFLGGEVVDHSTNTTITIPSSDKLIIHPPIWLIIGTFFFCMTHGCIFNTSILHKITTIKPTIIFKVGNMCVPRIHTNFTITICNTKLIPISIINLIFTTTWWHHRGCYLVVPIWTKPHIMSVSSKINFLGG